MRKLQAESCCIRVVHVCVLLFTGPIRESHTACRDAWLLCKSQPTAGWKPSPIGSNNEVREEGNMATESKTSHGYGDISSCWVKRLAVTDAHINIMLMHLFKNSHAACVLCGKCTAARYVSCGKKRLSHCTSSSCNPAKTKEPCSLSYVLIKGLIKSFLQLNEYLISQRAAVENCDETQRRN